MATFFLFGKYSTQAIQGISADRTRTAVGLIRECGGEVMSMYALLGAHDLVFIVSFPSIAEAMRASVALSKSTGIAFTTDPAVTVEEFDKLAAGL